MSFIGKFLFHIAATAVVFWAIETYVLPGQFSVIGQHWWAYGVVAFIFGLLNFWIKPFIKLAMLPINFITLGFASFVINGILLFMMQYGLQMYDVYGVSLDVDGLLSYVIAGVILGVAHTVVHWIS